MVAGNSVTIAGNVGSDPELRFTTGGTAVANFSIAHTPRRFDRDTEEWVDGETLWLRINAWGGLAENVIESIFKGNRVLVTGHLEQKNWENEEGEKRYVVELTADDVAPSLLFATAEVTRNEKRQNTVTERKRPAKKTAAKKTAAGRRNSRPQDEEPPF